MPLPEVARGQQPPQARRLSCATEGVLGPVATMRPGREVGLRDDLPTPTLSGSGSGGHWTLTQPLSPGGLPLALLLDPLGERERGTAGHDAEGEALDDRRPGAAEARPDHDLRRDRRR